MPNRKIAKNQRATARVYIPQYLYEYLKEQPGLICDLIVSRFPEVIPETNREQPQNQLNIFSETNQ
jgi:hypothetical protein